MSDTFPKNKIEIPTVGRIVWFYDHGAIEPLPATVTFVTGGLSTDLCVMGRGGRDPEFALPASMAFGVPHASERAGASDEHWDWMPFQKSQAGKTEELQRQLQERAAQPSFGSKALARMEPTPLSMLQAGVPLPVDGKR